MSENKQVVNCDIIASNSKHNMCEYDAELLTFFPDEIALIWKKS